MVIKSNKGNFIQNTNIITKKIKQIITMYSKNETVVIMEYPEYWGCHIGQQARESSAITKLHFTCGAIWQISHDNCKNFIIITPSEWKGQLPKQIVRTRIMPFYPKHITSITDHNIIDAIGIGHYYIYGKI